jgi:hypothetical protein
MIYTYLENTAYVSAVAVIGLTYLDCLLTIAGMI